MKRRIKISSAYVKDMLCGCGILCKGQNRKNREKDRFLTGSDGPSFLPSSGILTAFHPNYGKKCLAGHPLDGKGDQIQSASFCLQITLFDPHFYLLQGLVRWN